MSNTEIFSYDNSSLGEKNPPISVWENLDIAIQDYETKRKLENLKQETILKKELDDYEITLAPDVFASSEVLVNYSKEDFKDKTKNALFNSINEYLQKVYFGDETNWLFYTNRLEKLNKLWVLSSDYSKRIENRFETILWILFNESSNLYDLISSDIKKQNIDLDTVTAITVHKWKIILNIENWKKMISYDIRINESRDWLSLMDAEIIDSENRIEQKEDREKDANINRLTYFWWALALWLVAEAWFEWVKKYSLQYVKFTDRDTGKVTEVRLPKTSWFMTEERLIKESIMHIETQTWYVFNKTKEWKYIFESPDSRKVSISDMIATVESLSFDEFKKNYKWDTDILDMKNEFEKQKSYMTELLIWIELEEWPLVKPSRFLRKIISLWNKVPHLIMFPIFFHEIQKKPWNLESYFKWIAEMQTFELWAKIASKIVEKLLIWLTKKWPVWIVLYWMLQLVFWIVWWWVWVAAWKLWANVMELQKKFDGVFPESEDFIDKYSPLRQESNDILKKEISFISGWFNNDIADLTKMDLKVPFVPITFWQHHVDLNTNKQDHMSVWSFRNKAFYNERVDEYWDQLTSDLQKLINDYLHVGYWYWRNWPDKKRWARLFKKIADLIYGWNVEENKEIKDSIYNIITVNLSDDILEWKQSLVTLKSLVLLELEKYKINDEYIENTENNIKDREAVFNLVFWIVKEVPSIDDNEELFLRYSQANIIMETSDMFKYMKSLSGPEKEFAKNYYYRILNKQEVIQTEQVDSILDAFNYKKVWLNDSIWFFSSIWQSTKDWLKLIRDSITWTTNFVDWKNSDESIYERLIKNKMFFNYTLWVKQLKSDKEFIEKLKNDKS